jgi:hypothetical protein
MSSEESLRSGINAGKEQDDGIFLMQRRTFEEKVSSGVP